MPSWLEDRIAAATGQALCRGKIPLTKGSCALSLARGGESYAIAGPFTHSARLAGQGGEQAEPCRAFYLTQASYTGGAALDACAPGFHMASLWEIFDPSNLKYDTSLGFTTDDSGSGPPSGVSEVGWVRTGRGKESSNTVNAPNCAAWTNSILWGTVVRLESIWLRLHPNETLATAVSPWVGETVACSTPHRVWCVED